MRWAGFRPNRAAATVALLIVACMVIVLAGCTAVGTPIAAPTSNAPSSTPLPNETIRQTDDAGKPLPFTNKFPNRWSEGNDGTAYEPCTAFDNNALRTFGIDPTSAKDAALADYQTLRGCRWRFLGADWEISQFVANQPPLARYRLQQGNYVTWYPDVIIEGTVVAVGSSDPSWSCTTYFWAGRAMIATTVWAGFGDGTPTNEICAKAIEFTELTLPLIPE